MSRSQDEQIERIARSFRKQRRSVLRAVIVNVCLAAVFLGIPFGRGFLRSRASQQGFTRFAACLLGARALDSRGLGLPAGEREQFAGMVLNAGDDWPGECVAELRSIASREATFLWPNVKRAEADIRAAAALVERELDDLIKARQHPGSAIPSRPLRAVSRLQAAVAILARATLDDAPLLGDAVAFPRAPVMIRPADVPFSADAYAPLHLQAGEDGVEALALDATGVHWTKVAAGKLERRRMARPALLRAVVRDDDRTLLVWTTPRERCRQIADRCAFRSTGIAFFDGEAGRLSEPIWLKSHPAGRPDRVVRLAPDGQLHILALYDATGALALRRFTLPALSGWNRLPVSSFESLPLQLPAVPLDVTLLSGSIGAVAYAATNGGMVEVFITRWGEPEQTHRLTPLEGRSAWLTSCEAGSGHWIAYGTDRALSLARVQEQGVVRQARAVSLGVTAAADTDNPRLDRFRLLCTKNRAHLLLRSGDRDSLMAISCHGSDGSASCRAPRELARAVRFFDAVVSNRITQVAFSGDEQHPQIRLLRLDRNGEPLGAVRVPAACWTHSGGLCGVPYFAKRGKRIVLAAHQPGYLSVIETVDGGESWKPMSGLKKAIGASIDTREALRAHRERTGGKRKRR